MMFPIRKITSNVIVLQQRQQSRFVCAVALLLVLTFCAHLPADVLVVPDDYDTIQEAIDEALDGDTVEVDEGTYTETIDFLGKSITVVSLEGARKTVINGDQDGSVVTFENDEDADAVLEGFTITNGSGTEIETGLYVGGGIYITEASPTIQNNVITGNQLDGTVTFGAGIYINYGEPRIANNVIRNNSTSGIFSGGGGIGIEASTTSSLTSEPIIEFCTIHGNTSDNTGGGIASSFNTNPSIRYCVIADNEAGAGGGVAIGGEGLVENCTIYGNDAGDEAGGIFGIDDVVVRNCIVWGNTSDLDEQVTEAFDLDMTYCTVDELPKAYDEGTNMDDDPSFMEPTRSDYRLGPDSPCIDAGDPDTFDDDGSVADLGAIPFETNEFLRGDANGNGVVAALTDTIFILQYGFSGGDDPACMDAADVDDDDSVEPLIDALALLLWAFQYGEPPADPGHEECGYETERDELECGTATPGCE